MFLFLLANIVGSTIQITTLPLPLLSTLQASGLVFNSILASLLLQEPFTLRTGVGTLLVAIGAVLISLFSALPEPSHSLDQLLALLGYRSFLVWFILSLVLVVGILATTFFLQYCLPVHRRHSAKTRLIRGMAYGFISGILSAHALLLAKSAVELIVRSFTDRVNQFKGYQSWLLVLAFLVLALTQLYYLHRGLKLVSTSILYPFVFCVYNIIAILDGLIYFRQMDRLPPSHAGLIALGTVVLLTGVLALSWRLQDEEDKEHEHAHLKPEMPQTVLAPGMGFVHDPESAEASSAVSEEDEDTSADEEQALLSSRPLSKSKTAPGGDLHFGRKRKRAATLKEVQDIWNELGDDEEHYGTFDTHGNGTRPRPSSAGHSRQQRRRRSSGGQPLESSEAEVRRSATLPVPGRGRRRRSTQLTLLGQRHQGSALLTADWYKLNWWRKKDKDGDGDAPAASTERSASEGR